MVEHKIGVLALQGDVREHLRMINQIGHEGISVKREQDLKKIDALIMPGGESTTLEILMQKYGLYEPIKDFYRKGRPLYGTCAGLILLSKKVSGENRALLGLMDIDVQRNAYGRQRESFEAEISIKCLNNPPFKCIFIRAPWIVKTGKKVEILAEFEDKIVMAKENNILVTSFHPELSEDKRVHQYFVKMIKS